MKITKTTIQKPFCRSQSIFHLLKTLCSSAYICPNASRSGLHCLLIILETTGLKTIAKGSQSARFGCLWIPKRAQLLAEAEADVLAFMSFPKSHRGQMHSTNPLEQLDAEIKRRTNVVGIFPNEPAVTRLVGALRLKQNDEWQPQLAYWKELTFQI